MDRWRRGLALVLGVLFILAGVAESIRAVSGGSGGLGFWFGSLCGGGAAILLGTFRWADRRWASFGLVAAGCLAGSMATAWTVVVPVPAMALFALALHRAITTAPRPAGTAG